MTTRYLGIESIIIQYYDKITIAANVMFEGVNYDQPVYTNIFCDYYELRRLLNLDNSQLGHKIKDLVVSKFIEKK
jgi:3-polyprenyl-4-hydroxybenzoate decarboxylase